MPAGADLENVIQFPTRSVRSWNSIRQITDEQLIKSGMPEFGRKRVIENMKKLFDALDVTLTFTPEIPFEEQFQKFTSKLLLERLIREIEVCGELNLFG